MIASQELDRMQFFQPIVESISLTLRLPVSLWLPDTTGEALRIAAATGLPDDYIREAVLRLDEPSVAFDVFATGQAIVVLDITSDDRWKYRAEAIEMGLKSAMVAPLQVKKKIVGVLDVYAREVRSFSEFEKTLIERFATQLAITQRRLQDLAVLNEVSLLINSELQLSELFRRITRSATRVLDCQHVSIFLVDKSGDLVLEVSSAEGIARERFAPEEGLAGWVAKNKQSALVSDAVNDPRFVAGWSSNITERSMLVVPIIHKDEIIGIISADRDGLHGFDEHDQSLLEILASQAGVAVRNARLFEQETSRAAVLQRLHQIGEQLLSAELSTRGLEEVLHQVAQSARGVLGADLVDVYQYVQAQNRYILPPVLEGERHDPFVPKEHIFDDDIVVKVTKDGNPIYTPDAQTDSLLSGPFTVERPDRPGDRFVVREGVLSSAAVPLKAAGATVGVMFVNYRTRREFTSDQRDVIELFANQAATAIYNARLFQQISDQTQALIRLSGVAQRLVSIQRAPESTRLLLEQIAESAKEVLNADIVELYEYLPDQGQYRLPQVSVGERRGPLVPKDKVYEDDAVFQLIQREEPLYVERARGEPIFTGPYTIERTGQPTERYAIREELESVAAIPLKAEKETVGLMFANFRSPQVFTIEQKRLIELFANQAATAIHNTRLFQRTRNQAQALIRLSGVAQRLVSIQRAPESTRLLLEQIAESAKEVLNADIVELYEYLPDQGQYRLPQVSVGERRGPLVPKDKVYEDDAVFQLIQREEPLYVERARGEPIFTGPYTVERTGQPTERYAIREGLESVAAVPLKAEKETVGLMFVNFRSPQAFTVEQRRLIELFANQAAVAIHNYELNQRLARRAQALAALNEVGQTLTAGIRLKQDEILELIYEQAEELAGTQDMYIALFDEETGMIRFGLATEHGERVHYEPREADMQKRGKTEEVIFAREPILHRTLAESEAWYGQPGHQEFIGRVSSSWLGVPMVAGDKVLGMIAMYDWEREYAYDEQDLQVVSSMASQAAIALDNAMLYYEINRQLTRRVEALAALNEIGQTLTSGIRLKQDAILELIYEQAKKLTGTQDMYIALYDEETGMIRFGLATEHSERVHYEPRKADMEKRGKTEEVIFAREPILHRTLAESEAWYGQPGHQEFIGRVQSSYLGVPMVAGDKVLGMIAMYDWERGYTYDEQDLQIVSSMASQAAIALDNATLYYETNRQLESLYEEARSEAIAAKQLATLGTAIAALQHRINNTFNIIVPNVTRLRNRVDMTDETIVEILDIIERNARYTSDIITRIQEPLREVEVQDVDVNAVLSDVVSKVRELWRTDSTQPLVEVTLDLDDSIPQIQAPIGQVAEVFRNLVDNGYRAMKVGGQLTVTSQYADDMIQVRVRDTGGGIPPAVRKRLFVKPVPSKEPGGGAGLGLWLSRLMLRSIGSDVTIGETGPTGTTMLVQIPAPGAGKGGRL